MEGETGGEEKGKGEERKERMREMVRVGRETEEAAIT